MSTHLRSLYVCIRIAISMPRSIGHSSKGSYLVGLVFTVECKSLMNVCLVVPQPVWDLLYACMQRMASSTNGQHCLVVNSQSNNESAVAQ